MIGVCLYGVEKYINNQLVTTTHYFFEKSEQLAFIQQKNTSEQIIYRGITINPFNDPFEKLDGFPNYFEKESNDSIEDFLEFKKRVKPKYHFLVLHLFLKMYPVVLPESVLNLTKINGKNNEG